MDNAKRLAKNNREDKIPEQAAEILRRLDDAEAADRAGLTAALMKQGKSSLPAISSRQTELEVHVDMLRRLAERIENGGTELVRESAAKTQGLLRVKNGVDQFLKIRYELCLDRLASGDYLGAHKLANALVILAPGSAAGKRAKKIRRVSKQRLLRETVLYTELLHKPYMSKAARPKITLQLTNRSDQGLLLLPRSDANGRIGTLVLNYEAIYAGGINAKRTEHLAIRVNKQIAMKPGENHKIEIEVPPLHHKEKGGVLGRYSISGNLQPFSLERGKKAVPYFIPIFPSEMYVIEPRDFVVVRDPLASYLDRLDDLDNIFKFLPEEQRKDRLTGLKNPDLKAVYTQLFISAVLAGALQREKTFTAIENVLPKAPKDVETVLLAALSTMTGDPFRYSKAEWLAWLRRRQHRSYYRPKDFASQDNKDSAIDQDG